MTRLRPFSDHQRGLFISVDGPSGAGRSMIAGHFPWPMFSLWYIRIPAGNGLVSTSRAVRAVHGST